MTKANFIIGGSYYFYCYFICIYLLVDVELLRLDQLLFGKRLFYKSKCMGKWRNILQKDFFIQ